jgi:peptidyl-prolyl cis-trans isomerase D
MLFSFITKHKKWILVIFLVLIVPPFALFGIDQYFRDGGRTRAIARVGDYEISHAEFSNALRDRQQSLREMLGGRVDPAMLDSAELRRSVLDTLVRQRVLINHAVRSGLVVTDEHVRAYITQAPVFQEAGQFSMERYEHFLRLRGDSPASFENRVRQELLLSKLMESYVETNFASRTASEWLLRISEQQREVSRAMVPTEKFVGAVKLEEDAAKKYYAANPDEFRIPEQARVEYVALTMEALMPQVKIDPAEVKQYYEGQARQFGVPESRQASHILIAVDKGAAAEVRQKARAQAEEIAKEARANPQRFPELAKKYSQDPGSAAAGGDLGSFGRGTMVPAFEDAVFGMKAGEISDPVESEFGFHVIRVTGITPAKMRGFEQVRGEIETEMRKQQAGRKFAELAEKFSNTVFEQSESLKPAAELIGAKPQTSGWLARGGAEEPLLNNPRMLQAIFSHDVLVEKRNTEAIETAPGAIVAARLIEHKPAAMRPFEEVHAAIEKRLVQERASQLAAQHGRELLQTLRAGEKVNIEWGTPQLVSRADPQDYSEPLLRQVYRADAATLPSYTGVETPAGFTLLRVTRVTEPEKIDRAQQRALGDSLAQVVGEEQFRAYLESLKQRANVRLLDTAELEGPQR